ncbi:Purple acid phosphatase [[Candida] zeylanoides]
MLASTLAKIAAACVGAAAFHLQPLPRDLGAPTQQRLAYLGDTGMTVSWNTYEALAAPSVRYGLAADALTEVAHSAESVTYQTSTTWSNHVELTGLSPATTYYYQVQNDANVYSFTTAKPAGATDAFSFGVVIDMGTMGELGLSDKGAKGEAGVLAKGERNTVEALAASLSEYDFLWHPGDIAYADYWLKEEYQGYLPNLTISDGYKVYEQILNAFYNQIQPVSSLKPYMVGPGNHEADCDNGGYKTWTNSICSPGQTNFEGFNSHWRMPSALSGGTKNMWYSFDYGLVHYVQFDTETDFPSGLSGPESKAPNGNFAATNAQLDWLRRDLASVNRTRTPWVIAAGHRPWYVAGSGCKDCQTAFEATLVEFGVDVVVAGHVHNYERIGPIGLGAKIDPNGLANPSAPWYILNGIGGHYDGVDALDYPLPPYVRYAQDSAYGWSRFTVHNCSHLTHEFVVSSNGTVLDRQTLFKDRKCGGSQPSQAASTLASSSASSASPTGHANSSTALSTASSSASAASSASAWANSSVTPSSGAPPPSGTSLTLTELSRTVLSVTSCADGHCKEVSTSGPVATETDKHTTVVTITSCSDNLCHEVVSTVPASAPVPVTETDKHTAVVTITSCSDNLCHEAVSKVRASGPASSARISGGVGSSTWASSGPVPITAANAANVLTPSLFALVLLSLL